MRMQNGASSNTRSKIFTSQLRSYDAFWGPPDLTGLGFGVPIGSADLSAPRTFG